MLACRRDRRRASEHFTVAAQAIGAAVLLDGLDGRIARMTNTTSAFRPRDGFARRRHQLRSRARRARLRLGRAVHRPHRSAKNCAARSSMPATSSPSCSCSAAPAGWRASTCRSIPIPKNPGRPDRKYFVGLPIPAAAAMVCRRGLGQRCPTARLVAALRRLARPSAAARLPHGQHLALLQFQGHQSEQGLFAAHHYSGGRVHLRHVELRRSFCCSPWRPPTSPAAS